MAKVLVGTKQYLEVDLGSFHEPEIQSAIAARAELIYPGFLFVSFDALIQSEHGTRKPDFMLVDRDYRSWWICEVELIHHSLYNHVIPQIRAFRDGQYGDDHVRFAVNRNRKVDPVRLRILIETERPNILVVANRYSDEWANVLQLENAKLGVFEIFRREDLAEFIFRLNGFTPEPQGDVLSLLEVEQGIPRLLRVNTPSAIPGHNGEQLQIIINGAISDWQIMLYEDKAWLMPLGGHRLDSKVKYGLKKASDNTLHLEKLR